MVGTQVDIFVGVHRIVAVQRTEYLVTVQTFARRLDFSPRFIPLLKASMRRRIIDWVMPVLFVFGVLGCAWLVLH